MGMYPMEPIEVKAISTKVKSYESKVCIVDESILNFFTFDMVNDLGISKFSEPFKVIISDSVAELLAGDYLEPETPFERIIISEKALDNLGYATQEEAFGQTITFYRSSNPSQIHGVFKNFHQRSLKWRLQVWKKSGIGYTLSPALIITF